MKPATTILGSLLCASAMLAGCSDACSSYSDYSCKEIDAATYNVYFWFPDGEKDYYVGTAKGLSACGQMAYSFAESKELEANSGWSYICCMQTDKSGCAEKHR